MVEFYEVDGLGDYQITVNPGKYWVYAGGIIDEDFDQTKTMIQILKLQEFMFLICCLKL